MSGMISPELLEAKSHISDRLFATGEFPMILHEFAWSSMLAISPQ